MASVSHRKGTVTAVAPSDLNLYHDNPREGDVPAIMSSLRRHTQYAPITANIGTHTGRPFEVLKGNHTTMAFRELAAAEPDNPAWRTMKVFWVDVDDDLAKRIVVADNKTGQLGGFDTEKLLTLLDSFNGDIDGLGYVDADIEALRALDRDPDGSGGGDQNGNEHPDIPEYSSKTDVPHYTPTDDPPELFECIDTTRTSALQDEILDADLPDDVREFLLRAAHRHTVLNFHKIADYYASAPPAVQRLMENQALVIIDVDNAIQQGYVRLTNALRETLEQDLTEPDVAAEEAAL